MWLSLILKLTCVFVQTDHSLALTDSDQTEKNDLNLSYSYMP